MVGGSAGVTDGDGSYFVVLRFNKDGTIDKDFGTKGRATAFSIADWAVVYAVAIQEDGKIIEAGDTHYPTYENFALARYTQNGHLDSSFGRYGKVTTNFYESDDNIYSIVIQTDGKIIAAGYSKSDSYDFALARYMQNGQPDSSFGVNGKVTTDFANGKGFYGDRGHSVIIQADGKIIAAGQTNNDFAIARYNNDKVLPVTIINLKAYSIGSNVHIEWTALNQLNIAQYNIEHSVEGKSFIALGNIKAFGSGQQKVEYSYTDQVPAGGDNFYRIKSVSKDGATEYTNTVKVNIANTEPSIVISPNPVKNILHIEGLSSSVKTISIVDAKGKLFQQITTSNSSYSFNVKRLSTGVYFIRIGEGDKTTALKFIKE